jgi:NADPH:quinone reductase-like Zn-dependent oxidoreductase
MTKLAMSMHAVHLTGHRGFDKLEYHTDVPVPVPGVGDMLVQVGAAAGVNNTDVNTRIGWYSKKVTSGTDVGGSGGYDDDLDGGVRPVLSG